MVLSFRSIDVELPIDLTRVGGREPFNSAGTRRAWLGASSSWLVIQARINHRRFRALNEAHDQWAVLNCAAHDFGIVYTTLAEKKRQLAAAGFKTEQMLGSIDGRPVTGEDDTRNAWFHLIARQV